MQQFKTIRDTIKTRLNITNYPKQFGVDHLLETFVDLCLELEKVGIKIQTANRVSYGNICFTVAGLGYDLDLYLLKEGFVLFEYYDLATTKQITDILNKLDIGPME